MWARDGDGWRIEFAGSTVRLAHRKGLGDLATLLVSPGTEVPAMLLVGGVDVGGDTGTTIDETARRAYEARIRELQSEVDDASADNDTARAEKAEIELDALVAELTTSLGLGGRARTTGSTSERARSAVTYRIRSAIGAVGEQHPRLGRHLHNAVRTGTWCCYQPEEDPGWRVTTGAP